MDELTSFGNKLLTKVLKLCYEMKKKKTGARQSSMQFYIVSKNLQIIYKLFSVFMKNKIKIKKS